MMSACDCFEKPYTKSLGFCSQFLPVQCQCRAVDRRRIVLRIRLVSREIHLASQMLPQAPRTPDLRHITAALCRLANVPPGVIIPYLRRSLAVRMSASSAPSPTVASGRLRNPRTYQGSYPNRVQAPVLWPGETPLRVLAMLTAYGARRRHSGDTHVCQQGRLSHSPPPQQSKQLTITAERLGRFLRAAADARPAATLG